jgi:transposase-like protein
MTRIKSTTLTRGERQNRHFSESFKVKKVQEIERGITRISEICKEYEVSDTSVRKWILKYSTMKKKTERLIVESQSDTQKILDLKKQIAELERLLGQKQIQLEFKDTMIEIAEEMYKIDIKKKLGTKD